MASGSVFAAALLLQALAEGAGLPRQSFEWREEFDRREAGEYGAYDVDLEPGKTYFIETHSSAGADPFLYLFHPHGFLMTFDDDGAGGSDARVVVTPRTAGRYTLKLRAWRAGSRGRCSLSVRSRPPPTLPSEDRPIRVGDILSHQRFGWQHGKRHEGEYAQYSVALAQGERVTIRVVDVYGGNTGDAVLYVLKDSTVLAMDDDSGPGLLPRLAFEAPETGTYRIRLRSCTRGAFGAATLALEPADAAR